MTQTFKIVVSDFFDGVLSTQIRHRYLERPAAELALANEQYLIDSRAAAWLYPTMSVSMVPESMLWRRTKARWGWS